MAISTRSKDELSAAESIARGNSSDSAPGQERNIAAGQDDHTAAAQDGNSASASNGFAATPYGANNEQLPGRLQSALRSLVEELARENSYARRQEVKKVRQARMFWKGQQYLWWNEQDQNFHTPFQAGAQSANSSADDQPRYQYVTNIYQPFGLALISVLSQSVPATRLFPESPTNEQDITTAKAGSKVIEFLERNNDGKKLLQETAFYLYTDGKVGGYVRYVVDGQRFGFTEQPVYELVETRVSEDSPDAALDAAPSTAPGSAAHRAPETVMVPRVARMERVPNGQEVISILGALELKTPLWAREQHEFPYLMWSVEAHLSKLRAAYPHASERIQAGGISGEEEYERIARLQVTQGGSAQSQGLATGDNLGNLVTFQRTWLRPWAFYSLQDVALRQELLKLFPDGCYVAFAGDAYCEARNESMDDRWRVIHAMPGDGQDRPALGEALIPVQERLNDLANITMETYEYGIPSTFVDSEVLDIDALEEQTSEPGAMYPVSPRPGQPVGAGFFTTPQATVSPDMLRHMGELAGPLAQFVTGAFPALMGGDSPDQKTATGYAMQRDQAMGRMGLPWTRMRKFYSELMLLALESFRENRFEDVAMPVLSDSQEWAPETIHLADLKGQVRVFPETDENFPTSWTQQRQSLLQLMQVMGADPVFHQAMSAPENMAVLKRLSGLDEIALPGDDARVKQYREIAQLISAAPLIAANPATGAIVMTPTILPDEFADDHASELETCKRWLTSESGQLAKAQNPEGFANVRAHAMLHQQIIEAAAAKATAPAVGLPHAYKL
ncbi:MAG: hypothetical protein GZ088_13260 [Acidipila sp.]|nr:hypothetical protein [Acidipila sp.]